MLRTQEFWLDLDGIRAKINPANPISVLKFVIETWQRENWSARGRHQQFLALQTSHRSLNQEATVSWSKGLGALSVNLGEYLADAGFDLSIFQRPVPAGSTVESMMVIFLQSRSNNNRPSFKMDRLTTMLVVMSIISIIFLIANGYIR